MPINNYINLICTNLHANWVMYVSTCRTLAMGAYGYYNYTCGKAICIIVSNSPAEILSPICMHSC